VVLAAESLQVTERMVIVMIKEVNAVEFKEQMKEGLVLVDFFSTTCGPCKMLSFVLKDVDKAFENKLKILQIDFDQNKDVMAEYQVTGYPTLILFKDGNEVKRLQGLQQKPAIIKMVEENK
jgi:thioredoxin 1